ncbi:MAG: S8 family serine peptidase [Solirubrobacterales bacterium]|nr:S8 family serine peptidase [Solirubrobacterales bacterium]
MGGSRLRGALGGAVLAVLLLLLAPAGSPADPGTVALEVRFSQSANVRGAESNLRAANGPTLDRVERLFAQIGAIGAVPLVAGLSQAESTVLARKATRLSGSRTTNMADWYRIEVPAGSEAGALEELRDSGQVAYAGRAPVALPPPVTPDFSPSQLHLDLAPTGVGAEYGQTEPRVRGAGVTVVDLEYYWTRTHEDLQLPASSDLGDGEYIQYTAFDDEHGTAVFGILNADDNGFGVTGIVPEATMKGISPTMAPSFGYNPAGALTYLADKLDPGDVVLIEQQADGPGPGPSDFVPMEWGQASFDAIRQLSDLGVVVVETGGNGGYDLDGPAMLNRFDRSVRDSDAILVGAGDSATRAPLWFTSHGSRIDLQGYGNNIVTTGSDGDLQGPGPGDKDTRYTSSFGGTSGAGPVVAGAVAAVLSYLKATDQPPLNADQLVGLLRSTGTAQSSPELGQIGPLPNIPAAIATIQGSLPTVSISSPADGSAFDFNSGQSLELACGVGAGPELASCLATDQGPGGELNLVTGDQLPTDQPGTHTLTATATNELGLTATDTVTYEVGPGCIAEGVTLASAEPRGRKVRLLGAADPSRAGERVKVLLNGRQAGTSTVAVEGLIQTTINAPRSKRAKKAAGYRLVVDGMRSQTLKASAGIRILSRKPLPDADLVKAKLAGVKKKGRLTLRTRPLCGGPATSRQVSFNRRGIFTARLDFGTAARTYSIRRAGKSLPLPVVLPAARFVLID